MAELSKELKKSRPGGRLPIELIHHIIYFVTEDTATLRACALVCHPWNIISRSHIFRRVNIVSEKRLSDFELVIQRAPHLDQYIRELSIGPFSLQQGQWEGCQWVSRVPETLPRWLTRVRTIRFVRLSDAGEFCDAEFFAMFYYFVSATLLILEDCALNISVLQAFASSLPNLATLVITNMMPLMVTIWEAPPQLTSPQITTIVLDFAKTPSPTMSNFLDWLMSTRTCGTLRSAEFGFTILDAKVIQRCLLEVGPRLEHLGLHLKSMFHSSEWEHDLIHREVDIGNCTALTSLALDLTTARSAVFFLQDVKASDLRALSFQVFMEDGSLHSDRDFDFLSHALMGEPFKRIKDMSFIQKDANPLASLQQVVAKALPELYARGVVRFLEGKYITGALTNW